MRQKLSWRLAICTTLLSLGLYSCGTQSSTYSSRERYVEQESASVRYQRNQERLRREYGTSLEIAVQQMVKAYSKELSPMSGKEFIGKVNLYDYEVIENQNEGYVACHATLRWMARDFWSGVSYDWCELQGKLYLYPRLRSIDSTKATFIPERKNEHVTKISSTSSWNKVKKGLTITL